MTATQKKLLEAKSRGRNPKRLHRARFCSHAKRLVRTRRACEAYQAALRETEQKQACEAHMGGERKV